MPYKLLLADDSITIQKVVGIIFAHEEYELTVVDNGDDALLKARENVPDVLLADALMPGKNGYELCSEIRRDPRLQHLPALLMTGVFEPFDEGKARESGADDFITKPFESQQLIDKVKNLLELGKTRLSQAPAASVAPSVPVAPAAASAAPVPPAAAVPVAAPAPVFEEASADDDLWGAVIEEEDESSDDIFFGEVYEEAGEEEVFAAEEAGAASPTADDAFAFAGEEPGVEVFAEPAVFAEEPAEVAIEDPFSFAGEVADAVQLEEPYAFGEELPPGGAASDEAFAFAEEPAAEPEEFAISVPEPEEFGEMTLEDQSFSEEPFTGGVPDSISLTDAGSAFEIVPEETPEDLSIPSIAPVFAEPSGHAQPAPVPAATAASGTPVFSEEQLAAALAAVSREIIEKIVWEVVPDLAETLIREEIRKIKEGA